ncbi:hypothetical protein C2U68_09825 [Methylomonas koyamae]|nr:hypothetical protein C2U68_09825 [Methylomonas koyamae]
MVGKRKPQQRHGVRRPFAWLAITNTRQIRPRMQLGEKNFGPNPAATGSARRLFLEAVAFQ